MTCSIRWLFALVAACCAPVCFADDTVFADGFDPPGVLLQGPSDALAIDALRDLPPTRAPAGDIEDGLILTRMDVYIDRTATVGQINDALVANGARIVTMAPDRPLLTLVFPRASGQDALLALRDAFKGSAGFLSAAMPRVAEPDVIPDPIDDPASLAYLHAERFPAAWNLRALAMQDCTTRRVPLRVLDHFKILTPADQTLFDDQMPGAQLSTDGSSLDTRHGYEVTMTGAARFDAVSQTGANPLPECLTPIDISIDGMTNGQIALIAGRNDSDGNVANNFSFSSGLLCGATCTPAEVTPSVAVDLAWQALAWRLNTRAFEAHNLFVTSAGNQRASEAASVYRFFAIADFNSAMNLSASPGLFGNVDGSNDDDLAFLGDGSLLDPTRPGYPSLRASATDLSNLRTFMRQNLAPPVGAATNVLTVGSTTNQDDPLQVRLSDFSRSDAEIDAVGEHIPTFANPSRDGTSFSAPQITGLATYLWLLSDDLRHATVDRTIEAITANAQVGPFGTLLVDAYASVLSLDDADATTVVPSPDTMPIRLGLVDVNDDGRFTEADIDDILTHLLLNGGVLQDWSRYDLNGDGWTGGFHGSRFDLDRVGSNQFSAAKYSTVSEMIEGRLVYFYEPSLLDSEILCYYAYSPLYTGDASARSALLGSICSAPLGDPDELVLPPGQYPKQIASGGGHAFAITDFSSGIETFDFASMGWDASAPLVTDSQFGPLLTVANRGNHGSLIVMGNGFDPTRLGAHRYDAASNSWYPLETIDTSAFPRLLNQIDSVTAAVSASGNAAIVWRVSQSPQTTWKLAAVFFNATTGEWSTPALVSDTEFPTSGAYVQEVLADDSGENIYINIFGSTYVTYRRQTATGQWSELEKYPGYSWHMGIDQSGRILGMGGTGDTPNAVIASHFDPKTSHWSDPTVVYVEDADATPALRSVGHIDTGGALQQSAISETCKFNFCVAANGDAVLLSAVAETDEFSTMRVSYYLADIDQWINRGLVDVRDDYSLGMGYYSGNALISWYDVGYFASNQGKIHVQKIDRLHGLGPDQVIFDASNNGWSFVLVLN